MYRFRCHQWSKSFDLAHLGSSSHRLVLHQKPDGGENGWSELRQACIVMGPQVQIGFGQSDPDSAHCALPCF